MERESLENSVKRYNTILRFITDDRIVAIVIQMFDEARRRLNKFDDSESWLKPLQGYRQPDSWLAQTSKWRLGYG